MSAVGKFLLSPVLALAGVFDKPKAPKVPLTPPPAVDRSPSVLAETFSRRRGSQANQRSGGGGEPTLGGKKTKLGT